MCMPCQAATEQTDGARVSCNPSPKPNQRCGGAQNGGTEASMEWVLAHMEDADFNDPLPPAGAPPPAAGAAPAAAAAAPDAESLAMLASMGFSEDAARRPAVAQCPASLRAFQPFSKERVDIRPGTS